MASSRHSSVALIVLTIGVCFLSGPVFVHDASAAASQRGAHLVRRAVPLANGAMSFDRVCREWRCKYTGPAEESASLEALAKLMDEYLPALKAISPGAKVNRMVCGGCLDFKLMTTLPLDDFGPWEEKGFAPEAEFLEKIKAIEGVSQVETQTITNMEF
eukprot:CAMPEP_0172758670 /NCGR_PEP_ID=MMETSP1074-20121228/166223_1 /TAXON_ID=2916 /ORGANISM="Ceratium fusus, Strain PA161109" /LENGTH=158 /DNA_ID=CAMNT_0013592307 /DNA_START=11 /DNA_END=487 /DNA_ORIENTATION=+